MKPDDIPEDVMALAEDAYLDAVVMTSHDEPKAMVIMTARAILAERERSLKAGYRLGFMASGEGWNGEYPFDKSAQEMEADRYWVECMEQVLSAALSNPNTVSGETE